MTKNQQVTTRHNFFVINNFVIPSGFVIRHWSLFSSRAMK